LLKQLQGNLAVQGRRAVFTRLDVPRHLTLAAMAISEGGEEICEHQLRTT
jgi:hypothetical protein